MEQQLLTLLSVAPNIQGLHGAHIDYYSLRPTYALMYKCQVTEASSLKEITAYQEISQNEKKNYTSAN